MKFLFKYRGCNAHVSDQAAAAMDARKKSHAMYASKSADFMLTLVHDLESVVVQRRLLFAETMAMIGARAIQAHLKTMSAFDKPAQAKFAATGQWPLSALNSLPADGQSASRTVNEIFDLSPTGVALQKYFHLTFADPAYVARVQLVGQVFDKILDRFKTGFKLELLTGAEVKGWNGRAMPSKLGERNVIRDFFGDSQVQYHVPRKHVVEYDCMQLPIDYVAFSNASEVARTLVHEMSHVAAFTEDVLYKHESFGKNEGEKNAAGDLAPAGLVLPGRAKPLQQLAGFARDRRANTRGTDLADSATYVYNADSYAWFARRMMKLTQPSTYQKFEKA